MTYSIQIKRNAQKTLAIIPLNERQRIIHAIYQLANEPFPTQCKKLTGHEAWRIRIGNYRVIYEVENDQLIIFVVDIGHRKDIYKRF